MTAASIRLQLNQDAPPGLSAAQVPETLAEQALREVLPFVPSRYENQLELQLSFGVAVSEETIRIENEISSFPSVVNLIEESMRALGSSRTLEPNRLNVIVRRYFPGQGIVWHTDKVHFFEEPVFGCVLGTKASVGLQFRHPADGQDGFRYNVPEGMGVTFLMTGHARYQYLHGIEKIDNERISVSWRWFKDSFITQMGQGPDKGKGKSKGKGKGKGKEKGKGKGKKGSEEVHEDKQLTSDEIEALISQFRMAQMRQKGRGKGAKPSSEMMQGKGTRYMSSQQTEAAMPSGSSRCKDDFPVLGLAPRKTPVAVQSPTALDEIHQSSEIAGKNSADDKPVKKNRWRRSSGTGGA